jgi:predicted CXXCH cytochrome family protein
MSKTATTFRVLLLLVIGIMVGVFLWMERSPSRPHTVIPAAAKVSNPEESVFNWRDHAQTPAPEAAICAECHAEIVAQWNPSQHALANRLVEDTPLAPGESEYGGVRTSISESLELVQDGLNGFRFEGEPVAVIAVEPLIQPLVLTTNGRWQVFNPAYHPEKDEWFNAFPDVRENGEWGHWNGRGMNWNVQCAWCHTTSFKKNYDPETDSYASAWKSFGVSCTQCHGDQTDHARDPDAYPGNKLDPVAAENNCYTCHARRGFLTPEEFTPGEKFNDHFRLALFDRPGTYYPDGQVRDENFETGSFLSSTMHDGGVKCLDCHNPHSGELTLPVSNNLLCMSCHAPPGQNGAIPILPSEHSHHPPGSSGNRCVECHMPETEYMESDLRRDHGFTSPDPFLTRTLGIPNACSSCHDDQSLEWAEEWSEKWYGEKLAARRTRPRAQAIQDAWDGDPEAGSRLAELARTETNAIWKASLIRLLQPYLNDQAVSELVQESLRHEHELVRAAAVHVLGAYPAFHPRLTHLRKDPSRLVRLDAAWLTRDGDPYDPELASELEAWLRFNSDQPAGALNQAQYALAQERFDDVELWADRMTTYDNSSEPVLLAARLSHASGNLDQAIERLETAVSKDETFAEAWYMLGMLRGEAGDLPGAMDAFRQTVVNDPEHGRAWYNLGLAHLQTGNRNAGVLALEKAESFSDNAADAAYALATVYAQEQNVKQAKAALQRALEADPRHRPSLQLMRSLP